MLEEVRLELGEDILKLLERGLLRHLVVGYGGWGEGGVERSRRRRCRDKIGLASGDLVQIYGGVRGQWQGLRGHTHSSPVMLGVGGIAGHNPMEPTYRPLEG